MISVGNGQLLLQRPVSQQMSAAHRPVFGIWLYFIKIHNLNTYDTLYTRHRQLLALTFSIISTESKYINYLVRAKRFFRDCIPGPRADHPAGNRCRKLTRTVQLPSASFHNTAFIAQLHIALLVRHDLTHPHHKFKLSSPLEMLNGNTNI